MTRCRSLQATSPLIGSANWRAPAPTVTLERLRAEIIAIERAFPELQCSSTSATCGRFIGWQSDCTAAIWRNDFGLELRVLHGDELVESRLSRVGEAPLLLIAEEVKAEVIKQGWFELPNTTG